MLKLLKKYINFIFNLNTNLTTSLDEYNKSIHISTKCQEDPLFFIDYYLNFDGKQHFKFTNEQLYVLDSFINKQKIIVKCDKIDQLIPVLTLLVLWKMILYPGINIGIITSSKLESVNLTENIKNSFQYLIDEHKPEFFESTASSVTLKNTNSFFCCRSARTFDMDGMFRGIDLNVIFLINCSKIKNVNELFPMFYAQYKPDYTLLLDSNENDHMKYSNSKEWFLNEFLENKNFRSIYIQ